MARCECRSTPRVFEAGSDGSARNAGRVSSELAAGKCVVVVAETVEAYAKNLENSMLKTYYEDGVLTRFDSLREMRERTAKAETQWIGKGKVVVYDNVRKRKACDAGDERA